MPSNASCSSIPSQTTVISVSCLIHRLRIPRRLFALISLSPCASETLHRYFNASSANSPAGRRCRPCGVCIVTCALIIKIKPPLLSLCHTLGLRRNPYPEYACTEVPHSAPSLSYPRLECMYSITSFWAKSTFFLEKSMKFLCNFHYLPTINLP